MWVNSKRFSGHSGFSLVEIIITLGIFAFILSLAVPSFHRMRADQKLQGVASDLLMILREIRSKAMNGTGTNSGPGNMRFIINDDTKAKVSQYRVCDENELANSEKCKTEATTYDLASIYQDFQIQFNDGEFRMFKFKPDGTVAECDLGLAMDDFTCNTSSAPGNFGILFKEIKDSKNITENCYVFQIGSTGIMKMEKGRLDAGITKCEI